MTSEFDKSMDHPSSTASMSLNVRTEGMKAYLKAIETSLSHLLMAGIDPSDISYRPAHDEDGPCTYIFVRNQAVIKHTFKWVVRGEGEA